MGLTNAIGRPVLDRCHEDRDDEQANLDRWRNPAARMLLVDSDNQVVVQDGRIVPVPISGDRDDQHDLLLGTVNGAPWFTRRVPGRLEGAVSARAIDVHPLDRELWMAAVAVLAWQDTEPTCPTCGRPTRITSGGPTRVCDRGHILYPRTDPAVIAAVLDSRDRIVLARQRTWPSGRCSVLAGFIEAGEPAEHALVREVAEETHLRVTSARYLWSQPWPFPRSLMLGFVARAEGDIDVGDDELAEADFLTRDEVRQRVDSGVLRLPPTVSVARRLIDTWLAGDLPAPESGVDLSRPEA